MFVHRSGEHALHIVPAVTEDDPVALWVATLGSNWFDLEALDNRVRYFRSPTENAGKGPLINTGESSLFSVSHNEGTVPRKNVTWEKEQETKCS